MSFTPSQQTGFTPSANAQGFPAAENKTAQTDQPTGDAAGAIRGLAELFGTSLSNIPGGALHGIHDIISRATGNGPAPAYKPAFTPSPNAQAVGESIAGATPQPYTIGDVLNQIPGVKEFHDKYVAPVKEDVGQIAGAAGIAAPLYSAGRAAMSELAPGAGAGTEAGNIGLRLPVNAGSAPAVRISNNATARTVLGREAGVNTDTTPVNHTSLANAAELPGGVMSSGAALLPTAPLSPAAQSQIAAARPTMPLTKPTPNVESAMNGVEQDLLGDPSKPVTGEEVRATRDSLSSDANAGYNSADADTRAIARYKAKVVQALDQHVADTMPANSAISPEMISNARATLAKNYNLRDLIGPGGDLNLQSLAEDYRNNPNKFTGDTAKVAQFAHEHPEATGNITNTDRLSPPGVMTDIKSLDPFHNPVGSTAQALFGAAGRRLSLGPAGSAEAAAARTPVAGLGGEFAPRPNPLATEPPPPLTAGPMGSPPAAAGPPGQIPLANVLAHGVEQNPAPGLTAGPMGAGAPEGIPFTAPPESIGAKATIVKGRPGQQPPAPKSRFVNDQEIPTAPEPAPNTPLGNRFAVAPDQPPLSDLPGVMSQGVPEGIMTKTQQTSKPGGPGMPTVNMVDPETHNAGVVAQVKSQLDALHAKLAAATAPNGQPMEAANGLHKMLQNLATNLDAGTEEGAFHKALATRLAGLNLKTAIRLPDPAATAEGAFGRTTLTKAGNTHVTFNNLDQDPLITIGHEATHAATMDQLNDNGDLYAKLQKLMTDAKKAPAINALSAQDQYGVTATKKDGSLNAHEMVAEATANPRFQQALRNSPSPTNPGKSMYDDYKKIIGTSLRLPPTVYNNPRFEQVLNGYGSGSSVA